MTSIWSYFGIFFVQVVLCRSCEFGSYTSRLTGLEACCIPCKTPDLYERFKEPNCPFQPNVCQSDSGIYSVYNVEDVLTDSAAPAVIFCPEKDELNSYGGTNFTATKQDYTSNITNEGNIKDLSCNVQPGTKLELGSHTVICTATDLIKGNSLNCNFTVLVTDNESPRLDCNPRNYTALAGENFANVTYQPNATDNSGEKLETKCNISRNRKLPIGGHVVTCEVKDSSLNDDNCTLTIYVIDNESPRLDCNSRNYTALAGENFVNVTYQPNNVTDNSGEKLEAKCNISRSILEIGTHVVSCEVYDSSLNYNSCSALIYIRDSTDPLARTETSSVNTLVIIFVVLPLCMAVGCLCYCKRSYFKRSYFKLTQRTRKVENKETGRFEFNSKEGSCNYNANDWLIVKNTGVKFLDLNFSSECVQRFSKVQINCNNECCERTDLSSMFTITDLPAGMRHKFKLTGFTSDGKSTSKTQYIETHEHLSGLFKKCTVNDVGYDFLTVNYECDKNITCNNVWLTIKDKNSHGPADSIQLQKVHKPNDSILHKFENLKPDCIYEVAVEMRPFNQWSTNDRYTMKPTRTKSIKISHEVSSHEVVIHFSDLDADCEPLVSMCCGQSSISANAVTITKLQSDCSYKLKYGVICAGKHAYQDQLDIRTPTNQQKFDCKCDGDILDILENNKSKFDRLIHEETEPENFLQRIAIGLKLNNFGMLKYEAIKLHQQNPFDGLLQNRKVVLDRMAVDDFLQLLISSNDSADEQCKLLTPHEDEMIIKLYQAVEEYHRNCQKCQPLFHEKIH